MFNIEGRKVLITGATGGIGKRLALSFYKQGCELFLHSTNAEKANVFIQELKAEVPNGNKVGYFVANLAALDEVAALAKAAIQEMGGVDVLVNNAGITKDGLLMRMSNEDFQSVLNINLVAASLLARDVSTHMLKQRFGRIINITSVVGVLGNPGQANYCASKAGLIGFSKSLARELAAKNVTVNCIAPGFVESAMTDKLNEKQKEIILASIPMRRIAKADEIVPAAIFLASDESSYTTGQTIHVNGGMAMI